MSRVLTGAVILAVFVCATATAATISGTVVGITDGDTITVVSDQLA
jgi:endonuclease YncB( thermonuclease family)